MLLGAAGLLTSLGIFLAARYVGPQAPHSIGSPGGAGSGVAIPSPFPAQTPTPDATAPPTDAPQPPARVFVLPTPTPDSHASWCVAILGWSHTLSDHLCPSG